MRLRLNYYNLCNILNCFCYKIDGLLVKVTLLLPPVRTFEQIRIIGYINIRFGFISTDSFGTKSRLKSIRTHFFEETKNIY